VDVESDICLCDKMAVNLTELHYNRTSIVIVQDRLFVSCVLLTIPVFLKFFSVFFLLFLSCAYVVVSVRFNDK